ncbi:MAG: hypothetical protein V4819_22085 [Verrucomicrobiota bacterium]
MASDHPFQLLFETLGRVPAAHAESVNRQAYEVLADILSVPIEKSGRCILLRAPRAGHGKTHLLSRIQHQLGASTEFIPLHAPSGCRIDAASVTDDTLRRLVRQLPASGGLTVLDLVTRRLFASALQPLVASGEVPCQDREGALTALRSRPIETFDFHHPNAATANWARENFEVLGQRLSLELALRADLPVSDVAFWIDLLFRFAAAPLENPGRVRVLADGVLGASGESMERLQALLGLLTLLMRVVLVADDLEGFSTDDSAALKLAAFLGALRQSVERLDVILSLNQDVWQSAFLPRLSGGLADRLSEVVVELEPLTEADMVALLDSRVPGLGVRVLEHIDRDSAGTHARGLIRAAGLAWLQATALDSAPAPVAAPEITPAPVAEQPQPGVSTQPPPPSEPVVLQELRVAEQAPVTEFVAPVFDTPPEVEVPAFAYVPDVVRAEEEAPPAWPSPEIAPPPPLSSSAESDWMNSPPFYPPADSPSHADTRSSILEPPASSFATPDWQQTASNFAAPEPQEPFVSTPAADQAELDSPFQMPAAPVSAEAGVPDAFTPVGWSQPPPVEPPQQDPYQEYASAPLRMEQPPAIPANPQPIFNPPVQPTEAPPPPTTADTDRVENLLRQFRDRYGRGSL